MHHVTLVSSDGVAIRMSVEAAHISGTVRRMLEATEEEDDEVPLYDIKGDVLSKVANFCEFHSHVEPLPSIPKPLKSGSLETLPAFYSDFANLPAQKLCEVLRAADFLDILPLMDLCSAKLATTIQKRTLEEVRQTFFALRGEYGSKKQ